MIKFFKKWKNRINNFLIKTIGIGLLLLILFLIGSYFVFTEVAEKNDIFGIVVLLLTAAAIMQYTKETYQLKEYNRKLKKIAQRQYDLNCAPFVILNFEYCEGDINGVQGFILENIGQGIARNINIGIIHHPALRVVIGQDSLTFPPITALKSGGKAFVVPVITSRMCEQQKKSMTDLIKEALDVIKPRFERHLDLEFEILYESAMGKKHKTILISSEFEEGYHIKHYE